MVIEWDFTSHTDQGLKLLGSHRCYCSSQGRNRPNFTQKKQNKQHSMQFQYAFEWLCVFQDYAHHLINA